MIEVTFWITEEKVDYSVNGFESRQLCGKNEAGSVAYTERDFSQIRTVYMKQKTVKVLREKKKHGRIF